MKDRDKTRAELGEHVEVIIDAIDRLRASLTPSDQAVELRAARVVQISDRKPLTSGGRLLGWSIEETAGAAARVVIRDGSDATGAEVAAVRLAANGSETKWLGPTGVNVTRLFIDVAAGAAAGAVYLGAVD